MQNRLFFICPTDRLESVINSAFNGSNYYYTSLGNSVEFDSNTIGYIKRMIKKHHIKDIYFVLAYDNSILLDAIGDQEFESINGLSDFYENIKVYNNNAVVLSLIHKNPFTILSSHLNHRIKELNSALLENMNIELTVEGIIFNKENKIFQKLSYSNLIWQEDFHLN